jgi:hypothetical protein
VKRQLFVSAVISAVVHCSVAVVACPPSWGWRHAQPTPEPSPAVDKAVERPAEVIEVPALEAAAVAGSPIPVPTPADHFVVRPAQRSTARGPSASLRAPASLAMRARTRTPAPNLAASLGGHETAVDMSEIFQGDPNAADALLYGEGSPRRDLSAPAMLGGAVYWDCPWPSGADRAGIDSAVVRIVVDVTATGEATAARLVHNAAYDFGERAIECAMEHHYRPGTDRTGRRVVSQTRPFPVIFSRTKLAAAR